ncbi:ABC transporter substrate-binding protein [Clostridium sp. BSD9I1]|uniref:ABC transporter substrate-binding protein n=1 Tax=Clostridium sp. BSD9I1 TaxID=2003589 RepID=UPI0016486E90|nr:extracellular solute-binding protein [Clostridium sp. BSD9I1]
MKRIISIILLLSMLISVTACSSKVDSNINTNEAQKGANKSENMDKVAEALKGEISGEINVSSYDSVMYKSYLEAAAKAFEAKYPGTKVNVSAFSKAPDVKTAGKGKKMITATIDEKSQSDYINQVNTELMTGKGADVLAMDILPYYKYAENGQIEDLSLYMEQDKAFNKDNYRKNILDAVSYKGGQYIFPLDYSFDFISYDKTLLNPKDQNNFNPYDGYTYDQLAEIGKSSFDEYNSKNSANPIKMFSLSSGSAGTSSIFNQLFNLKYDDFVDIENRTANFNNEEFINILEKSKEYEKKGYLNLSAQKSMADISKKNASKENIYKTVKDAMLLQAFDDSKTNKGVINVGGSGIFGNNDAIAGILKNDENEVIFDFSQAYALNSNSDNKKTAWEFIKFLASEEMQTSFYLTGRPINNKASEEKSKQQVTGELYSPDKATPKLNEKQTKTFNNLMNAVNKYSDMLNKYMLQDTVINQIIKSEVKYFFDGSKTAKEVSEIVQSKVELYLNE